jgi:hypothetical protein
MFFCIKSNGFKAATKIFTDFTDPKVEYSECKNKKTTLPFEKMQSKTIIHGYLKGKWRKFPKVLGEDMILFDSRNNEDNYGKGLEKEIIATLSNFTPALYITKIDRPLHTFVVAMDISYSEENENKPVIYVLDPNVVDQEVNEKNEEKIRELFPEWSEDARFEHVRVKFTNCENIADNCAMYPFEIIRYLDRNTKYAKCLNDIKTKILGIKESENKNPYIPIEKSAEEVLTYYIIVQHMMILRMVRC